MLNDLHSGRSTALWAFCDPFSCPAPSSHPIQEARNCQGLGFQLKQTQFIFGSASSAWMLQILSKLSRVIDYNNMVIAMYSCKQIQNTILKMTRSVQVGITQNIISLDCNTASWHFVHLNWYPVNVTWARCAAGYIKIHNSIQCQFCQQFISHCDANVHYN